MTTLYQTGLAFVKAILTPITGIGVICEYPRFIEKPAAYDNLFKATISGVEITRGWWLESPTELNQPVTSSRHARDVGYRLIGFSAWLDASGSYKDFRDLTETVIRALEVKLSALYSTFSGAGYYGSGEGGRKGGWPSLVSFDAGLVGSVLCHICVIEFTVTVTETVTYV